jgi:prepilin-type N-terminal cleavage/methylation domain-containing protein
MRRLRKLNGLLPNPSLLKLLILEEGKKRKGSAKGFTLVELLIVIVVVLLLASVFVVKGYRAVKEGQVTALSQFITKVEQAYTNLINNPLCSPPQDKQEFMNAASDSQCRVDATDHKGDYEFPDKIASKWNWDIVEDTLIIQGVPKDIGEKVVKIHPECTYRSAQIFCPLSPPAEAAGE